MKNEESLALIYILNLRNCSLPICWWRCRCFLPADYFQKNETQTWVFECIFLFFLKLIEVSCSRCVTSQVESVFFVRKIVCTFLSFAHWSSFCCLAFTKYWIRYINTRVGYKIFDSSYCRKVANFVLDVLLARKFHVFLQVFQAFNPKKWWVWNMQQIEKSRELSNNLASFFSCYFFSFYCYNYYCFHYYFISSIYHFIPTIF